MYFAVSTGYNNSIHVFKKFYRNQGDVFNKVTELRKTCYDAHEESGWKRFFYLCKLERRYKRSERKRMRKDKRALKINAFLKKHLWARKLKQIIFSIKYNCGCNDYGYSNLSKVEKVKTVMRHLPSAIKTVRINYKGYFSKNYGK